MSFDRIIKIFLTFIFGYFVLCLIISFCFLLYAVFYLDLFNLFSQGG